MVKLMNQSFLQNSLKKSQILIFSPTQIGSIFGLKPAAVSGAIHRYLRNGAIVRLRRGLYASPETVPPEPLIANKLYSPSYISLEFALSYYSIIPESVYAITSVTSKATRRFTCLGKNYIYRRVKKSAYGGYRVNRLAGAAFFMADPEKAYVDTQYFRMMDGQPPLSRLRREILNKKQVHRYIRQYANRKLADIITSCL